MRIISWNLGVGSPESGCSPERAWAWLRDEADADVLLLQEAVPPAWADEEWAVVVHAPKYSYTSQPWGCVILAREPIIEPFMPGPQWPWLSETWGSVAVAAPSESGRLWFASIHSGASALTPSRASAHSGDGVLRCDPDALWEIDVIAHDLGRLFSGRGFVAGGDLNSALLFDEKQGYDHNARLFANLLSLGMKDARPRFHPPNEVQSYFTGGADRVYQLDHVYADPGTEAGATSWEVLAHLRHGGPNERPRPHRLRVP